MSKEIEDELARLDSEIEQAEMTKLRSDARLAALTTERNILRAGNLPVSESLVFLTKDDAIIKVLECSLRPLRIEEIVTALEAGGRVNESTTTVSVYLTQLVKKGRVDRVERGMYWGLGKSSDGRN